MSTEVSRKKKRRKAKPQPQKDIQVAAVAHHGDSKDGKASASAATNLKTPITAHQAKPLAEINLSSIPEDPVDLTTCDSVAYEKRDLVPRVKYSVNGEEKWTPVVKRQQQKKRKRPDT